MPFFQVMRTRFTPKIAEIFEHPFNQGLLDGDLPNALFLSFLTLDVNHYLPAYGRALSTISRLSPDHSKQFAELELMNASYMDYLRQTFPEVVLHPSHEHADLFFQPTKAHHPSLSGVLASFSKPESFPEKIARITPCLWSFQQIGKRFDLSACADDNPYRSWLETYQDPGFVAATDALVDTLAKLYGDANLAEKQAIEQAFAESLDFELLILDSILSRVELVEQVNEIKASCTT